MNFRFSLALALGTVACGGGSNSGTGTGPGEPGAPDAGPSAQPDAPPTTPPSDNGGTPSSLPECKAQRAVFVDGGNGALSWFTLEWPVPEVITNFQVLDAYDNPQNAKQVIASPTHPLFARKISTRGLWEGEGKAPQPSVFVAGTNQTHTQAPTSILIDAAGGLVADSTVIQQSLHPVISAIMFAPGGPYGTAQTAPNPVSVMDVTGAIAAFDGSIPASTQAKLTPTQSQLARYLPNANATATELAFANDLAFTANAFKLGLLTTAVIPAFNDDPHGAFASGDVTTRADDLAATLDAFYADLAAAAEPQCSHNGKQLSLADNTVMAVYGDTPKDSFNSQGWADGTIDNANWMYMRSNGFTTAGWFGEITDSARLNFDPDTGAASLDNPTDPATAAAFAGTLYAIARGDQTVVSTFTTAPYDGVIAPTKP